MTDRMTRRAALIGLAALAACGPRMPRGTDYAPADNPDFDAWLARHAPGAKGARFIPGVLDKERHQAERQLSLTQYLAIATSAQRVQMGRAKMAEYAGVLQQIQHHYRVDAPVIAAIWGLESMYGTRMGQVPVISALATLAYGGRRRRFFEQQLNAALRIVAARDVSPARMLGSWAGAMGHTQFIPTSYLAYAVDFTGDGRRDIWGADPTDALASTAAYLARSGWEFGQSWGHKVRPGADMAEKSIKVDQSRYVLYGNANSIRRYNNAQSYVIGVGHLSDILAAA